MDKIKIGVVGCANIAKRSMIPAIIKSQYFELVAVASRKQEKSQLFATTFNTEGIVGYEELLQREDIDAIYFLCQQDFILSGSKNVFPTINMYL